MNFEDWMRKKPNLSEASVRKYHQALESEITRWAIRYGITNKAILEFADLHEFESIYQGIKNLSIFEEFNERGNGMYGAALNHFRAFLDSGLADPETLTADLKEVSGFEVPRPLFTEFCKQVDPESEMKVEKQVWLEGGELFFRNRTSPVPFSVPEIEVQCFLYYWYLNLPRIESYIGRHKRYSGRTLWKYEERSFRHVFQKNDFFPNLETSKISREVGSQTKGLYFAISKYVGFVIGSKYCCFGGQLLLDRKSLKDYFERAALLCEKETNRFDGVQLLKEIREICNYCDYNEINALPISNRSVEARQIAHSIKIVRSSLKM